MKKTLISGFSFIEILVAAGLLGVIGATILPVYPRMATVSRQLKYKSYCVMYAEYAAQYLYRWADLHPYTKTVPFEYYTDASNLDLSDNYRINQFKWADEMSGPGLPAADVIPNEYKASIKFWETDRTNRALVQIIVWYDENMNNIYDGGEATASITTMVTEKREL